MQNLSFQVAEASAPLFVDAYAIDNNQKWIFGSFWGHETIIQEFLARLTIPKHESGLSRFTLNPLNQAHERCELEVGLSKRLSRASAKTPTSTIVGALCHIWIFDKALKDPDHSQQEAYVLAFANESESSLMDRVWFQTCQLCPVPLLPHWRSIVLPMLLEQEWITPLTGVGIQGYRICLPDDTLTECVSDSVRSRTLTVDTPKANTLQKNHQQSLALSTP